MTLAATVLATVASFASASVSVPGHPFMALPASDGKTVFISVDSNVPGNNGIEVMRRDGASLRFFAFVPLNGEPAGLALSPDGTTLFIADDDGVAAFSATAAEQGNRVVVHYLRIPGAGTIEVQSSSDGAYVFFTNESFGSVGVAQFTPAQTQPWRFVGAIAVDLAPVGMALSADGKLLYVTSEIRPSQVRPCYMGTQPRATGTLRVIDVHKAYSDPASAMLALTSAGCSPVRVALSPDGATALVTARGDDSVLAFDTQKLLGNSAHAQTADIGVGSAPVGIAILHGGSRAIVADSHRFSGGAGAVVVIDFDGSKGGVLASSPAGVFPREITESPERDMLYVTNYNSQTIELIPESAIP